MTERTPMDLLAAGDHVAARSAADAILAGSEVDDDARKVAESALAATDADPWAVRTFLLTLAFVGVLAWLALAPHPSVAGGQALVEALAHGDEAAAQALFDEDAWNNVGQELYSQYQGQHGRAFSLSKRGRELNFVMVAFDDPPSRRYLRFNDKTGRIKAVSTTRPRKPKPPPATP